MVSFDQLELPQVPHHQVPGLPKAGQDLRWFGMTILYGGWEWQLFPPIFPIFNFNWYTFFTAFERVSLSGFAEYAKTPEAIMQLINSFIYWLL